VGRKLHRKRQLPPKPSLEQLRKRAKDLLRALRAGDARALARFRDGHPAWRQVEKSGAALHDAQWVLAREYGFESWPRLAAHVETIESARRAVREKPAEELVPLLSNRDWRAFHPVESHLARHMDVAMDAVLAGIEHENPRIRAACALLMDHGGDDRCIAPLRKALGDPVPKVRITALHSLQCQRCKNEPLAYDVIPDMIRVAEHDPDPKVRRAALGGMGIQPPNRALALAIERFVDREPALASHKGVAKMLRHHLRSASLEELVERIEREAPARIRQAAALNLPNHAPDASVAARLEPLLASEPNEILRRCLERGWRHHAGPGGRDPG
jgi:hypothetical protein